MKKGLMKEDAHNRDKWLRVVKTMTVRSPANCVDGKKRINDDGA